MEDGPSSTSYEVFMVMPFSDEDTEIYNSFIKPTVERSNFRCFRADDINSPTNITSDIIKSISESDLIIAELTGRNPNVFYELALAHTLKKPTIMISRDLDDVPFDLMAYRVIVYDTTPKGLKLLEEQIRGVLDIFMTGRVNHSNPVIDNLPNSLLSSVARMKDVVEIERNAIKRVCILAPDIELGPTDFQDVMKSNIERGVQYQYLVPNTDSIIDNLEKFVTSLDLGDKRPLFSARVIDDDYIESDVTLIDPGTTHEQGFILAPSEIGENNFRLVGGALFRLKRRFNNLWFKAQELY